MSIELREVKNNKDLKKFVLFPYSLYKNHKYWVPPLIKGELNSLRKDKNPAFDHCEAKYVLAYKNGKIVGRIAGIINYRFIEKWGKKNARFCWMDFIDDLEVSGALLNNIEQWAVSKGMESITGPLGFVSSMDPRGTLYEGFNEMPTISSVYNYEYYPKHFETHGFKKETDYVEYEVKAPSEIPEKATKICNLIIKRYKLKKLEVKSTKEMLPYGKQVFDVLNAAFEPLFGFVPLTDKQIDYFTKKYFSFVKPEYTTAVLDENDKLVGFQISIPSLSHAFQKAKGKLFPFGFFHIAKAMKKPDRIDILLVGVHPEYQNKGVNSIFMTDLTQFCIDKGIVWAESNGELEENEKVQNFWRYYDARLHKRTRIYFKTLAVK
jgi:ribosomal protein S18 acetylase RimI-like enzyme